MSEVITSTEVQTIVVDGESPSVIEVTEERSIIEVANTGPQGPAGGGEGGGDKTFKQEFTSSASVSVPHNLNKYPAVTVINSAKDEVVGNVEYADLNNLTVSFSAPFSGSVLCN